MSQRLVYISAIVPTTEKSNSEHLFLVVAYLFGVAYCETNIYSLRIHGVINAVTVLSHKVIQIPIISL